MYGVLNMMVIWKIVYSHFFGACYDVIMDQICDKLMYNPGVMFQVVYEQK